MKTLLLTALLLADQMGQAASKKNSTLSVAPILEIKDWMAAGSGCRARMNQDGNIHMNVVRDDKDLTTYHFYFDISGYSLDGTQPINAERPTFARECAFRVAAYPANRWRISNMEVTTDFIVSKSVGSTAELYTKLLTGSAPLGEWSQVLGKTEQAIKQPISVSLRPNDRGLAHLSSIECEQPKVLGADISLVNRRESFEQKVNIAANQVGTLKLSVKLSPCRKNVPST